MSVKLQPAGNFTFSRSVCGSQDLGFWFSFAAGCLELLGQEILAVCLESK